MRSRRDVGATDARLKVLISAHELSPYQGSECAAGWNLVIRIAQHHDVTVLFAAGSQFAPRAYADDVQKFYESSPNEFNIRFVPVPQPRLTLALARLNVALSRRSTGVGFASLYFVGYRLWQRAALRVARGLIADSAAAGAPFVLCHHLTQITFREPGFLWRLPLPFVWGPTGGSATLPFRFLPHIGVKAAVAELFRSLANRVQVSLNLRLRRALTRSALVYAFSAEDLSIFRRRGASRVEVMLDSGSGIPVAESNAVTITRRHRGAVRHGAHGVLRVLWVGQLVTRKALEILIVAIAGDPVLRSSVHLTVVGDGAQRQTYERLVRQLLRFATPRSSPDPYAPGSVHMTGWLQREEVLDVMGHSDVLVHTSYREATTNVIPEALSRGLPVVCHDVSGMSIAVTDDCGVRVPLRSYSESVLGFRSALRSLLPADTARDGARDLEALSRGALRRARELSWDSMAERISADYRDVVGAA